jgi:hypothetical protein
VAVAFPAASGGEFRRGDVNGDGAIDISDPVKILFGLFAGLDLACEDAADVDDSGVLDLSDVLRDLRYLFLEGAPPAAPWPGCGIDPTDDSLGCGAHPSCDVPDLTEGRAYRFVAMSADSTSVATFTDDPDAVVGSTSVLWDTAAPFLACAVFPETRNARWNLTRADRFVVHLKPQNSNNPKFQGNWPVFVLGKDTGESIVLRPTRDLLDQHLDRWRRYEVPLSGGGDFIREDHGGMDLSQVDWFQVQADTWGSGFRIWIDGLVFLPEGPSRADLPSLDRPDLDILYIQRQPFYRRYAVDYNDRVPYLHPGTEGEKRWPDPGEPVTFRAVVANAGRTAAEGGRYTFRLDGIVEKVGDFPSLAPDQEAEVEVRWLWQQGPHTVSLETTLPAGQLEICRLNNVLTVRTDSLTFGFWVEQGVKEQMRHIANLYGSFSVADWLRGQIERYMTEGIFLGSTYQPFAPQGVVQRVRVDKLTFVPDGSLPPGGTHAITDRDVDGVWGYAAAGAQEYANFSGLPDTALLHELSHQLGLIDLYQLNLEKNQNDVVPLAFYQGQGGLMGGGTIEPHTSGEGPLYASHDVYGLNSTYGHRRGFYGEYLFSIPRENVLRVLDPQGIPLEGAAVRLYQKEKAAGGYRVDAVAEIEGTSDGAGELLLPNRPVIEVNTVTGHSLKANPFGQVSVVGSNGLFLVEVLSDGSRGFGFLPLTTLNLAWARGETERAVHEVRVAWWAQ